MSKEQDQSIPLDVVARPDKDKPGNDKDKDGGKGGEWHGE